MVAPCPGSDCVAKLDRRESTALVTLSSRRAKTRTISINRLAGNSTQSNNCSARADRNQMAGVRRLAIREQWGVRVGDEERERKGAGWSLARGEGDGGRLREMWGCP